MVTTFKFGVLYQGAGQDTEEQVFGNQAHSQDMETFLEMMGSRVDLVGHTGYKGGLDTVHGYTGDQSVYTMYRGNEIMYHVSTLLPYSSSDQQQLERKRHVGNDIVCLVFQDRGSTTSFRPDIITSNFLHAFIVVQPEGDHYRVGVMARSDVPYFGPGLPSPPVLMRGPETREWIINKMINAELSSYKAQKFRQLKERTREILLTNLVTDLQKQTEKFLGSQEDTIKTPPISPTVSTSSYTSFFSVVKRVFGSRRKSEVSISSTKTEETDSGCVSLSSRSAEHITDTDTVEHDTKNMTVATVEEEDPVDPSDDQSQKPGIIMLEQTMDISNKYIESNDDDHNEEVNDEVSKEKVSKLQQEVAGLRQDKLELIRRNMVLEEEAVQ